jgi:hypothetical protein
VLYVHCASHSFNLALTDSCEIRAIRNTVGTIKEVYKFIRSSSSRSQLFEQAARELNKKRNQLVVVNDSGDGSLSSAQSLQSTTITTKCRKVKLANVCPTRWVDRHVAVETFTSLFPAIISLLIDCMESSDGKTLTKSNLFYRAISCSEFLCSLPILNKILSFTINVARKFQKLIFIHVLLYLLIVIEFIGSLQNSKIDLMTCISNIEDILQVIQMIRDEPDEEYKYLFEEAQDFAELVETTIQMPRIIKRQVRKLRSV